MFICSSMYYECMANVLQYIINVWQLILHILFVYGTYSCHRIYSSIYFQCMANIFQYIINVWHLILHILSVYGTYSRHRIHSSIHYQCMANVLQCIINVWPMFFNVLSMYGEYSSISHLMYVWQLILQIFCTYGQCPCYGVASVSRIDEIIGPFCKRAV